MRLWIAFALTSVAVAAWLALRGSGPGVVAPAPVSAPESADGGSPPREPQPRELVEPERAAARAVADEAVAPVPDAKHAALCVRALLPDGSPWIGGTLELTADEPPVDLRDAPSPPPAGLRVAVYDGRTHRVQVETDAEGRAVFEPIVPGVAFAIRAFDDLDVTGAQVMPVALSAGERRELDLSCSATSALRGRCVDEHGAPLAGADIHVSRGEWSLIAACDGDGRFETKPLFARWLTLRAQLDRRAACERTDVDPSGEPVELTLHQGRSLLVETFDAAGELVVGAQPTIHLDGDARPLPAKVTRVPTGWQFSELPGGPLKLRWDEPCRPRSQDVDAEATRVRVLEAPRGRLVVEVAPLPHDPDVEHTVAILCDWGTRTAAPVPLRGEDVQQVEWELAPGRYHVQRYATSARAPGAPRPIGSPLLVEVRADETRVLRLDG